MLLIAYGTRPEWIKIKPVIDAIEGVMPYKILFTGQHTSLIDKEAQQYDTIDLKIEDQCDMRLDSIISSILQQIPSNMYGASHVIVQGDTTTAFAVALAAFHRQAPVIHLEAGLRTWDNDPYPEEFNRAAITALASIHLCPTVGALYNIYKCRGEGAENVYVVGNTVLDALVDIKPIETWDFVLVTMHRRENLDQIQEWFKEIDKVAKARTHHKFIFPMHPNPKLQENKHLLEHVEVIDAVEHKQCIDLLRKCKYVITDSGGIQEESSFLKKKAIVCRKATERIEGIGVFAYMCQQPENLEERVALLEQDNKFIVDQPCPYGDGNSAAKIRKILEREVK